MEKRIDKLKTDLRKLGFVTKKTEDENWYGFTYGDIFFRFSLDEEQDSMTVGVGYYQEHRSIERDRILVLINRLNEQMNFLKVIELGDVFWLAYEMDVEFRMPGTEEIRKMIMLLTGAYYHLISLYAEIAGLSEADDADGRAEDAYDWDGYVNDEKSVQDDD